jgi:hypothetical protein
MARAPEAALQRLIVRYLDAALPSDIWWSASMAGVKLSRQQASKAKYQGLRKGAPDISLLFPDGVTRYIEVKAKGGRLTPEQALFINYANQSARIAVVCRSLEDVEDTLLDWCTALGLKLRASLL